MQTFFREIFDYHRHFNQKLLEEIKIHQPALPARSFPLFCHILNAHQIWNARISNCTELGVQQVHPIEKCDELNQQNYADTLKILESHDLETIISYKTSKGQPFDNKIRDILFHVANHTTHHRGQIVSDFRLQGILPLVTDYIFFKRP